MMDETLRQSESEPTRPDFAFYYPYPTPERGDWLKSLILFFDGVAFLLSRERGNAIHQADPAIAAGLEQHGLLRILDTRTFVDQEATEDLITAVVEVIGSGALDILSGRRLHESEFMKMGRARLGFYAAQDIASMVYEDLKQRGLARPHRSDDESFIEVHWVVMALVQTLLAQILRRAGQRHGLELHPATDRLEVQQALTDLLGLEAMPSAGHVVSLDIEEVGLRLDHVPIDDVLEYRADHGLEYRRYVRNVRRFVREMSLLPAPERAEALRDRKEALADAAASLRRAAKKRWQQRLPFLGLGATGAAWSVARGDPLGAVLSLATNLADTLGSESTEAGAFSYLLAGIDKFW